MATQTTQAERVLGGRYRLGRLLGRGGMAEVYEGLDERLGRPVAVKVLRSGLRRRAELRERFAQEARSAARLSHPNVVAVYDTGEDDGTPFLVMERLPGETLADRLAAGPVEPEWLRRLAGDVLAALGAAHDAGVLHRDVKPGNILIAEDGCAKVADFGIAKTAEEATGGDTTATGMLLGTPAYLAPERIDGRPATPASDLYSLGVVLYEALAGRKPFDGDTPVAVAHNVRHAEVPPLRGWRPDLDPTLVAVVERAMHRDPSARFAAAREMAEALGVHGRPSAVVGPLDGDATSIMRREALGNGDGTTALPVEQPAAVVRRARSAVRLPWWVPHVVVTVGILLLLAALVQAGRNGTQGGVEPERAELAGALRDLAGRVRVGDGPRGPELGDRLGQVASEVEAGGGSQSANALLADVAAWHGQRQVYDRAASEATSLLLRVPGAQLPTTTTAAPTTTQPPEDGDDDDRGRGKKGKGDD
ncbi:MAG TPA: serine/threonine-protein kinase [Acidimicrobiales bacterium]|nr:serine/threonine-protein kinase [Acidimicrobiales bacterium]